MRRVVVGTRGSALALAQTEEVLAKLRAAHPDVEFEVKVIKTAGDEHPYRPLTGFKRRGIFERGLDRAVARGDVDFAVHSMKDVPTVLPAGLAIAAVPERAPPNDVLVSRDGLSLSELPTSAVVGTGSPRRAAMTLRARPDVVVRPVRGNIDTRLKKLDAGELDAVIVAEAGLLRLGVVDRITDRLDVRRFTPMPGQGALAVTCRADDGEVASFLSPANDEASLSAQLAERSFLAHLGAGCRVPIGGLCQLEANAPRLKMLATGLTPDGTECWSVELEGDRGSPEELGARVAAALKREVGGGWLEALGS
ncbi:MAG: hydroxymethylbilane synthase [Promethearchaeota archaeon]